MDPFTQRMLERTRLRREKLEQHFNKELELGLRQPLMEKNNSNVIIQKEQEKNNDSMSSKSNFQMECVPESENSENREFDQENKPISVPVNYSDFESQKPKSHKFCRLAELATRIREWEDEVVKSKECTSTSETNKINDRKKVSKIDERIVTVSKPGIEKKSEKQVIWDRSVIKSLESQGYALSKNESRLIYDFENEKEDSSVKTEEAMVTKLASSPLKRSEPEVLKKEGGVKRSCGNSPRLNTENKDSVVMKKAAFFESHHRPSPNKTEKEKDPTELSISERKALFEKNAGEALLPKVAFATPLPAKLANKDKSSEKGNAVITFNKNKVKTNLKSIVNKFDNSEAIVKPVVKPTGNNENENKVKLQKEKFERGIEPEKDNDAQRNAEVLSREKELEYLKSRWNRNKTMAANDMKSEETSRIPEPPPMPETLITSPLKTVEEKPETAIKKLDNQITKPDNGRLYPSLSEFEETDESDRPASDSDSLNDSKTSNIYLNMSFSDILQAKRNEPLSSNEHSFNMELRESQVLNTMDEFLDNALNDLSSTDDYDSEDASGPSPPKAAKSSSFEYKSNTDGFSANPLVHTVSFYRRQQQNSLNCNQTPNSVKSIKREENVIEKVIEEEEEMLVENRIQELLQEINKQQTIISQASQALNLCLSTVEFSNSGEQVESERLLLLANHKRQACLNEIQRLKVENTIRPRGSNQQLTEKGDVVITNISVPLKRDALRAMATVESMQYLVCLIKSDERVVATPAVPATRENLKNMVLFFPGQYKLERLLSDFKVTIEVYNLELSKEMLPHEVKYHIVNKKDKKLLTPIKSKKADSKLVMPYVQSPAGPNAVRTSNFHLCGYVVFSLREVGRTNWTLNKVPYTSPLEGTFSMKIESQLQLDTEFRGFLTMFDDISGFGAWHRRWCLLSSHTLSYWKYPDDETRKVPIGTIDLRGVITENVGLVSRDICARLHTFLLETTRPRQAEDKSSLVLNVQGDTTRIRHLLSADGKDEMLLWCRKLNTTLALLRSWRCNFDA